MAGRRQLGGELEALRLAARERGRALAELEVAEAELGEESSGRRMAGTAEKSSRASSAVIASTSPIDRPWKRTAERVGSKRQPPQASQGT